MTSAAETATVKVRTEAERTRPTSLGPNSRAEWQRKAKFDLYAAKAKR